MSHEALTVTNDERDEIRRILVAYHDVATWCSDIAKATRRFVLAVQNGERPTDEEILATLDRLAHTMRYLESNNQQIGRVAARLGFDSSANDPRT